MVHKERENSFLSVFVNISASWTLIVETKYLAYDQRDYIFIKTYLLVYYFEKKTKHIYAL